jgi:D-alanyl-D-alanine carboxypeptidase (penicillin-binding protein 5/6)
MTTYVVLTLLKKFGLDEKKEIVDISQMAAETQGTTAELAAGDQLNVWDMLHGLMLPSGNDAAMALAEHFGNKLLKLKENEAL